MRTFLRGKITLLFMTCAVILLVFPAMASAQGAPTITSDKEDYAPGELVTLTGGGWQPGESVHINVNDTYGATWTRNVDVIADASGNITDSFNLPNAFVSDYDVTATGAQSGTVRTTFTDSQPNNVGGVSVASPTSATVTQGDPATYGTVTVDMVGNSNTCTVTLGVATQAGDTGLPTTGAAASFGNSPVNATNVDFTSSLSVSTTGATPPGTYTFHVKATRGTNCQGNGEVISTQQLTLVVNSADTTAPTVTASAVKGDAPDFTGATTYTADTWTNKDVKVTFTCADNAGGSGLTAASGNQVKTFTTNMSASGTTASFDGTCKDNAGNTAEASNFGPIKIDKDAPTISSSADRLNDDNTVAGTYTAGTWTNKSVRVSFSCNDGLSGINTTSSDIAGATLNGSGENQSVSSTGSCVDQAGNTTSGASFTNIDIDKVAPSVALVGGPANGSEHYFGSVPSAPTCSASDALSGLNGACSVSGYGTTVGTHTVTATANDNAANSASASNTYKVLGWTLAGFKSPVDMGIYNDAKGGSTVPLKFEVFAGPTELTSTSVVDYFTQKVNCASGEGDAIEQYSTGNTELRYDTTSGQYIFNWKTPKAPGSCYKVTLQTDDGSQISADFRLK